MGDKAKTGGWCRVVESKVSKHDGLCAVKWTAVQPGQRGLKPRRRMTPLSVDYSFSLQLDSLAFPSDVQLKHHPSLAPPMTHLSTSGRQYFWLWARFFLLSSSSLHLTTTLSALLSNFTWNLATVVTLHCAGFLYLSTTAYSENSHYLIYCLIITKVE